ncbi:hypothetical protein [Methanoregula sp.]|uniref:hypothetical protein n=1 Tax=Methanoregula sp. TaxID=2052170 RepID=UPI00356AA1CE
MSLLSDRIVKETTTYLGPASLKFLQRQTVSHMNGLVFENIEQSHLPDLAKWVETSAGLLIGKDKALQLAEKIRKM